MLALVLSGIAGWLLGSIPVAYLVVRLSHGIDLRRAGSMNVGANNAMRSTGSSKVGIAVLLLDSAKGAGAVLMGFALARWAGGGGGSLAWFCGATGILAAVAGHNYNLFLSLGRNTLAGGKGLATAAGGFLLLTPTLVGIWAVLWLVGLGLFAWWRGVRDAIPGNVLATAMAPPLAWLLYGGQGLFVVLLFAFLVLPRHRAQMRALLSQAASVQAPAGGAGGARDKGLQETVKPPDMA